MNTLRALFVVAAVALAGAADEAEEVTAGQSVGYAIISAMAPNDEPSDRAYGWQAVGSRLGGPTYWHLAPPEQRVDYTHRTGWVQGTHDSAGVAACGGESVRLLAFRLDGPEVSVMSQIRKSFEESGVALTPRRSGQLVTLENFAPGLMRVSEICTRPGSAVMRHCSTHVEFALLADDVEALVLECRAP